MTTYLQGRLICGTSDEAALVRQYLPEHQRLTLQEPGNLTFNILPTGDPLIWTVDESFINRAAFDAHQTRIRASVWLTATGHITRDYRDWDD